MDEQIIELIKWGSYGILALIVFAETGLLIGFFLPGDSLLFIAGTVAAGALKAQGIELDIVLLNIILITAAITGDTVGYWFGRKTGPRLFARQESRFFKREHLVKTQEFYEQHGGKTIILARWMPFARTFAPIVAGVAEMPYGRFMTYNVVGGITWVMSMTLLGYFLGNNPIVKKYNEPFILGIIVLSLMPAVIHFLKERRNGKKAMSSVDGVAVPADSSDA